MKKTATETNKTAKKETIKKTTNSKTANATKTTNKTTATTKTAKTTDSKKTENKTATPKKETLPLDVFGYEIAKRNIAKGVYLDYINIKKDKTKVAEIWVRRTGYQICTKAKLETKVGEYVLKEKWQVPHTYNNLNKKQVEELVNLVLSAK